MVNENKKNSCCIIGHRTIEDDVEKLFEKIGSYVKYLVENKNVTIFKFGFYGAFNDMCYNLIAGLKIYNPQIKLVLYSLNNEIAYTFEEAELYQKHYNRKNKDFTFKCFDEILYLNDIDETKFKHACVLRNKKLIDESDYCMIYFRNDYSLPTKNDMPRNSGTKIAYDYAVKQKKKILIP